MRALIVMVPLFLFACGPANGDPAGVGSDELIDLLAETNGKVEEFQYSPDGTQIAYVSARNGSYDIWVMNSDGSGARAITDWYPEQERNPRWSPDGEWIAYESRGEIFKVPVDGSTPPVNLTYGSGGSQIRWTPDGESIVFVRTGPNGFAQLARVPARVPNGPVELEYLTTALYNHEEPQISPDGQWVAFTTDRSEYQTRIRRDRLDIYLMPIQGGEAVLLTPGFEDSWQGFPRGTTGGWSPDGTQLAFVSDHSGWRNIGIIDVRTRQVRMITESAWDEYNPQWSPDGRHIAYVANRDWNFHLMTIPAGGGVPLQLTARNGVSGGFEGLQVRGTFRWSPDSRSIAYTHMSPSATNDIWLIPAEGGNERQLTNHMPQALRDHSFVSPELITYSSMDGLQVPAFLYTPEGLQGDELPPLLVYARANTHGLHVNGFYPFIQYFVSRGFVVLAPQVRGSAGLGKEYERLNFGDWGGGDIEDIVAGVEHLVEEGLVDPERVVMQGGSTGGYFTMQTIVRFPTLLRAAVNFYGPTDLVHMYGYYSPRSQPILGDVVGGEHGDPTQALEHWQERSAIYHLDRIQTPLLILWGDRDYGVRISMADEYVAKAREAGKFTDYVLYNNEPHGWYHWRPETLASSLRRVAEHYDTFLKD